MRLFYYLALAIILLFASCGNDNEIKINPSVDFSAKRLKEVERTVILAYDTVVFESKNVAIDSCHWDFGDDEISKELNPKHVFTKSGKYQVKLTGYSNGKELVKTDWIEVKRLRIAHLIVENIYGGMNLEHTTIKKAPENLKLYLKVENVELENNFHLNVKSRNLIYKSKQVDGVEKSGFWARYNLDNSFYIPPVHNENVPDKIDFQLFCDVDNESVFICGRRYGYWEDFNGALFHSVPFQNSYENDEYYCVGFIGPNGKFRVQFTYE
ncbi:PKD domain-containing protein [Prolixibacteraceae bacterium JC049]|nr:PKD domain-containing protein [Prolixibacteraceae bacterium JC049]